MKAKETCYNRLLYFLELFYIKSEIIHISHDLRDQTMSKYEINTNCGDKHGDKRMLENKGHLLDVSYVGTCIFRSDS